MSQPWSAKPAKPQETTQQTPTQTKKPSANRNKLIGQSEFQRFVKQNEFKYLKLYPYLSQVEKTLRLKDEYKALHPAPQILENTATREPMEPTKVILN